MHGANSSPLWRARAAAAKAASAPTLRPLTAWPRAWAPLQDALHAISPGIPASSGAPGREGESWSAALQAVWELDLWGKFRNSTAAAREQLLATEAGQRGVLLSLAGQTTIAYFDLRNYDAQLNIAKRTLQTREEALKIYQARYDEGLISELDFLRAKTETDTMRANVYTAEYQVPRLKAP